MLGLSGESRKRVIHYGQQVRVTAGFYEGCLGTADHFDGVHYLVILSGFPNHERRMVEFLSKELEVWSSETLTPSGTSNRHGGTG